MQTTENETAENETPETQSKKLVIVREFDAPKELVWKAWTDEEHHKKWWGPEGYTSPNCKIDLRVGGKYLFCMLSPKGKEYWTTGIFMEISEPDKLVYTDSFSDNQGNVLTPEQNEFSSELPEIIKVTVLLVQKNKKTIMTLIHEGIEEDELKQMAERVWNEAFDKMAASFR